MQKANKIPNLKESKTDNNPVVAAVPKNEITKPMEHSKSKEKIIQQAFFSNINNSYGSLTAQKNPNLRNVSSGGIKTPNSDKFPNNIGVSYNVNSVRSPKINNNFGVPSTTQKTAISKVFIEILTRFYLYLKENFVRNSNSHQFANVNNNMGGGNVSASQGDHKSSFNLIEKYLKT